MWYSKGTVVTALGHDISRPLKNSFIHTGHGDVVGDNSWGNIAAIDEEQCLAKETGWTYMWTDSVIEWTDSVIEWTDSVIEWTENTGTDSVIERTENTGTDSVIERTDMGTGSVIERTDMGTDSVIERTDMGTDSVIERTDMGTDSVIERTENTGTDSVIERTDMGTGSVIERTDMGTDSVIERTDMGTDSVIERTDMGTDSVIERTDMGTDSVIERTDMGTDSVIEWTDSVIEWTDSVIEWTDSVIERTENTGTDSVIERTDMGTDSVIERTDMGTDSVIERTENTGTDSVIEVYLRNPMDPPDISGISQEENPNILVEDRSKIKYVMWKIKYVMWKIKYVMWKIKYVMWKIKYVMWKIKYVMWKIKYVMWKIKYVMWKIKYVMWKIKYVMWKIKYVMWKIKYVMWKIKYVMWKIKYAMWKINTAVESLPGRQFNYSKLKSEKPSSVKGPKRPPPPSQKSGGGSVKTNKGKQQQSPSKHPQSCPTDDDHPLIDLSEDWVSVGTDNKSLQPAHSHLSLFDSLCTRNNASHYGNIQLPKPLLNSNGTEDPFDIAPSFRLQFADTPTNGTWPSVDSSGSRKDGSWATGRVSGSGSDTSRSVSAAVNSHRSDTNFAGDAFSSSHTLQSSERSTTVSTGAHYSLPPGEEASQYLASSSLTVSSGSQIGKELERTLSASLASSLGSASKTPVSGWESQQQASGTSVSQVNGAVPRRDSSRAVAPVPRRDSSHADAPVPDCVAGGGQAWSDPSRPHKPWACGSPFRGSVLVACGSPFSGSVPVACGSPFSGSVPVACGSPFTGSVPVLPRLPPPPGALRLTATSAAHNKQPDPKAEKAFDWLNDAISHLALSRAGTGISPTMTENTAVSAGGSSGESLRKDLEVPSSPPPRYDEVPHEDFDPEAVMACQQRMSQEPSRTGPPPLYEDVPAEREFTQAGKYYGNVVDMGPEVPPVETLQYQQYACASEFSDDFDDDEFDDDFYDASASKLREEMPPPLPPKDYQGEVRGEDRRGSPEKPHIFPVVQDGKQLSHTHYFLIPPKDRCPATATVQPFLVHAELLSDHDANPDSGSQADYQNISLATSHLSLSSRSPTQGSPAHHTPSSSPRRRPNHQEERPTSRQGRRYSKSSSSSLSSSSSPSKSVSARSPDSGSVSSCSDWGSVDWNLDGGHFAAVSPRERVAQVQSLVGGVTAEEGHAALCHCRWEVKAAARYLKVEQLFRLGLASRPHCRTLLEALHWDLQAASALLLDQGHGQGQCESSV
ncbi:hypothetical protein ACOMHN_033959 [Nucella lapillus]